MVWAATGYPWGIGTTCSFASHQEGSSGALALISVFSCQMGTTCLPGSTLWDSVSGRWVYMGQLCASEGLGGREGSSVGFFQEDPREFLLRRPPSSRERPGLEPVVPWCLLTAAE